MLDSITFIHMVRFVLSSDKAKDHRCSFIHLGCDLRIRTRLQSMMAIVMQRGLKYVISGHDFDYCTYKMAYMLSMGMPTSEMLS